MFNVFTMIKNLSKGAFSQCVLATNSNNKYVVLKKTIQKYDETGLKQNELRELYCLKKLHNHPNIIKLLDTYFDSDGEIIFILNYIPLTLDAFIKNNNYGVRYSYFTQFTSQMLSGLHYLHSNNIVHTDLKSNNILVDYDANIKKFNIKIIDFGSAWIKNITEKNTVVTTARNRAPEVFKYDCDYNDKIDIWALGMILYYYLYGQTYLSDNDDFDNKIVMIENHIKITVSNKKINKLLLSMLTINKSTRYNINQAINLFETLFQQKIYKKDVLVNHHDDTITNDNNLNTILHEINKFNLYLKKHYKYINPQLLDRSHKIIIKYLNSACLDILSINYEHIIIAWYVFYQFSHTDIDYTLSDLLPHINLYGNTNYNINSFCEEMNKFIKTCQFDFI